GLRRGGPARQRGGGAEPPALLPGEGQLRPGGANRVRVEQQGWLAWVVGWGGGCCCEASWNTVIAGDCRGTGTPAQRRGRPRRNPQPDARLPAPDQAPRAGGCDGGAHSAP